MGPRLEGPNLFLLILGLVLNSLVLFCHGGRTSSYVRRLEATVDMPLDSDVFRFPPGYNAPQQVRIHAFSFYNLQSFLSFVPKNNYNDEVFFLFFWLSCWYINLICRWVLEFIFLSLSV